MSSWMWAYPGHIAKEGPVGKVGMDGTFAAKEGPVEEVGMHGTFAAKEGSVEDVGMDGTFSGQKAWTWWKRRGKCIVCERKWFKLSTQLKKLGNYKDGRDS